MALTEREAYLFAFGPDPEPELDGAGRQCFAELMRTDRHERRQGIAWRYRDGAPTDPRGADRG